jgi:8-oxo-dGTP diphosphatase
LSSSKSINPNVSVDCVVFGFDHDQLKILLIQQKLPQAQNSQFALPGDLILNNEGLDTAATRVLKEVSGLEGIFLKQFKAFGDPRRVSNIKDLEFLKSYRKNPQARVITVAYFALVRMDHFTPSAKGFAAKAFWQNVSTCPPLAFDHNQILSEALEKLRHDFTRNRTGFEMLPELFTLSQLQKLYEVILGRRLDKRNFRKKILHQNLVNPTTKKQKGVLHKPALLYRLKKYGVK